MQTLRATLGEVAPRHVFRRESVLLLVVLDVLTVAPCLAQSAPEPHAQAPAQTSPAPEPHAQTPAQTSPAPLPDNPPLADEEPSLIIDAEDGAFDISDFLSSRTGFLPLVMPVTEPAVGYGLAGALAFFHDKPRVVQTPEGPRVVPPNVTAVGGMATENDSWAAFAGHMHQWQDGRIRYAIGGGYGSLNLDWFGQGDAFDGRAFSYELDAWAEVQKLTFKLGDSDFFLGAKQRFLSTETRFDAGNSPPPLGSQLGIQPAELDGDVSGLGAVLTYDTRNSLFSPTRGTKGSLGWMQNDELFGSDFEYGRIDAEVCQYVPLDETFTLGMRGETGYAGENAPFFDLPGVNLRGIQIGRYVDDIALTLESELRWDIAKRWTLVGFGGVGWVSEELDELWDENGLWAGGTGFRYLVARKYDMRLGLDVARGPEDWACYVTLGTGWLRD